MHLSIKVITRAKNPRVQFLSPDSCKVHVSAVREKGKANEALIKALARYFQIPKTHIRIIRGAAAKNKIVEIER